MTTSKFLVPFRVFDKTSLRVMVDGIELGQGDFEFEGFDWFEIQTGYKGGRITLDTPTDGRVTIWSDTPPARITDIPSGTLSAEVLDLELDKAWSRALDERAALLRAVVTDADDLTNLTAEQSGLLFLN